MPFTKERWQSSRLPAPNAWATSVSRPIRRPPPKNATTLKLLELMLTAPMAPALSGKCPTMTVSTMPMVIQPISARTSGKARRRVGRISARSVCSRSMAFCGEPWKCKRGAENEQTAVRGSRLEVRGWTESQRYPTPPGNADRCQNKRLAEKAIRKNMKTKGEQIGIATEAPRHGAVGLKFVPHTPGAMRMVVKRRELREKQVVRV